MLYIVFTALYIKLMITARQHFLPLANLSANSSPLSPKILPCKKRAFGTFVVKLRQKRHIWLR